jgi:hypothetical protein
MHAGDNLDALDLAVRGDDGVLEAGLGAAFAQPVAVFLRVAELERVLRHFR